MLIYTELRLMECPWTGDWRVTLVIYLDEKIKSGSLKVIVREIKHLIKESEIFVNKTNRTKLFEHVILETRTF